LTGLLENYFQAETEEELHGFVKTIEVEVGGDFASVAGALPHLKLWAEIPRSGRFIVSVPGGRPVEATYELPDAYRIEERYPVLLCMPDETRAVREQLAWARQIARNLGRPMVVILLGRPVDGAFWIPQDVAGAIRTLLRETRRRIHTDPDQTILFGNGRGADAAWMAAIGNADLFAVVLVSSGFPSVPYAEQTLPTLLRNLESVPVLTVWSTTHEDVPDVHSALAAALNRAIVEYAAQAGIPVQGFEAVDADVDLGFPVDRLRALMSHRRPAFLNPTAHWFRYPGHGSAGWIRQRRFAGQVWHEEQLSIVTPAGSGRDAFITEVIQGKLAYLAGRIEGQTIRVEARKCAEIELRLPWQAFDWLRPLTVYCNGRRRYHGIVRPSIRDLLECAYEDWEFDHPVAKRLTISIRE
jgi:hypothetical protein